MFAISVNPIQSSPADPSKRTITNNSTAKADPTSKPSHQRNSPYFLPSFRAITRQHSTIPVAIKGRNGPSQWWLTDAKILLFSHANLIDLETRETKIILVLFLLNFVSLFFIPCVFQNKRQLRTCCTLHAACCMILALHSVHLTVSTLCIPSLFLSVQEIGPHRA